METEIFIHPHANRVFTLLDVVGVTIEISHTEQSPVLDFICVDNGSVFQN